MPSRPSRRLWLQLLLVWCGLSTLPSAASAQETRLELELGGDLNVGIGQHCHPPSEPGDDTIECGDSMIVAGGGLAAILRPIDHLGFGIAAAAGRSLFYGAESSPALYRIAAEARGYLNSRTPGGFYAAAQLGIAWLDPSTRPSDSGPTVAIGLGHAWSAPRAGFGIALGLTGSLAFFGNYGTSRSIGYGTLGFVGLSVRLSYGLPL